jgi:DNA transformation protein and related proteins
MAAVTGFQAWLEETLAPLGGVRLKQMFGGAGLFRDDVMFALIADDVLYLKVDDGNRPQFEAAGSAPFSYRTSGGRNTIMSYWRAPEGLLDDEAELLAWARGALEAAWRAAAAKPKNVRRRRPAVTGVSS